VHPFIFETLYERLTRDLTVERAAFVIRVACYLFFGALLLLTNLIFDYARIRLVVEDRRSALAALTAGLRFVRRQRGTVLLYLANALMWLVLGLGELYILGRHYVKLLFYASETAFFQGALAHASYTAAPAVVWPDSPAAEAIANADLSNVG
jgi:hypothetical protein